jgi:hypothetical protein
MTKTIRAVKTPSRVATSASCATLSGEADHAPSRLHQAQNTLTTFQSLKRLERSNICFMREISGEADHAPTRLHQAQNTLTTFQSLKRFGA